MARGVTLVACGRRPPEDMIDHNEGHRYDGHGDEQSRYCDHDPASRGRPDQNRRPFSMWVIPEAGGVGGVLEVGLGDSPVEGAGGGGDGDGTGGGGLGGGADCNVSFR